MLRTRELNINDDFMRRTSNVFSMTGNLAANAGIIASGALYGGLHALAWESTTFKTSFELIAWRIACCSVMCGGPFIAVAFLYLRMTLRFRRDIKMTRALILYLALSALFLQLFFVAFVLLYLVSWVYLVVEVIRNVAVLDPLVYQTPDVSICLSNPFLLEPLTSTELREVYSNTLLIFASPVVLLLSVYNLKKLRFSTIS